MIELTEEIKQNFVDFSYEANSQRAFPDARDGLKPGQRACLWEMYDKGYKSTKPHVKSAKISGGTVAAWWPHGTVAIYDTFARMSQDWINNIPEVNWHGANGSQIISGEAAADRYTEARLAKSSEQGLLLNIDKGTVNMIKNFSEDAEWPEVFPALYPRLAVNGSQGIGMTIRNVWIPMNLNELTDTIIEYVNNGVLNTENLNFDFPTGGIITNPENAQEIFKTGNGKITVRGEAAIDKNIITITSFPYQVYIEPWIDSVKSLIKEGTLTGITNVYNNCSDATGINVEVECEGSPTVILNQLYQCTDLQTSFTANQWALVGKTPELLNLKTYLDLYISHNLTCIKRENEFDFNKAQTRLEIVNGLLKALEDIDTIITLIKAADSSNDAVQKLINRYQFTENQAKAIVNMKLGSLAHLESIELNQERAELNKISADAKLIIEQENKQKEIFLERLQKFTKEFGWKRRTKLIPTNTAFSKKEKEVAAIVPENCIVTLTKSGMIKRTPSANYKVQNRNGVGIKNQGDIVIEVIRTNSIDNLLLFSNKGRMYRLLVDKIPLNIEVAAKALVDIAQDEEINTIYSQYKDSHPQYLTFVTQQGYIKKIAVADLGQGNKKGASVTKLREGDKIISVFLSNDEQVIVAASNGKAIRINLSDVNAQGKAASGVSVINLEEGALVVAALPIRSEQDKLAIFSANGLGKKLSLNDIPTQNRGGKGTYLYKPTKSSGDVVAMSLVDDTDSILVVGEISSICIKGADIPALTKAALGNSIIKNTKIVAVSKIALTN